METKKKNKKPKTNHISNNYEYSLPFPDEIMSYIMMFLPKIFLFTTISLVCRHWYHLSCSRELWRNVNISIKFKNYESIKKAIKIIRTRLRYIRGLNIELSIIADNIIGLITKNCPYLKILQISNKNCNRKDNDLAVKSIILEQLKCKSSLEGLRIHNILFDCMDLIRVRHLCNLEHIELFNIIFSHKRVGISEFINAISSNCNKLKSLSLGINNNESLVQNWKLTSYSFRSLTKLTNLEYLRIRKCTIQVTHDDLQYLISNIKKLEVLRLSYLMDLNYLRNIHFAKFIENYELSLRFLELKPYIIPENVSYKVVKKISNKLVFNFWKHNLQNVVNCNAILSNNNPLFYAYKMLQYIITCIQNISKKTYEESDIKHTLNKKIIGSVFDSSFKQNQREFKFYFYDVNIKYYENKYFKKVDTPYVWMLQSFCLESLFRIRKYLYDKVNRYEYVSIIESIIICIYMHFYESSYYFTSIEKGIPQLIKEIRAFLIKMLLQIESKIQTI